MKSKFQENINAHFVTIMKVTVEDAEIIFKWRKSESGNYLRHPDNYSIESQINWIKSRDNNEINYIISSKESKKKVGTIAIYDVNKNDKVANVGRLLLAEEYLHKSTPYGLESLLLTYKYVFNEMDIFKITGDILGKNEEMFKLQKFLGMKQEGYFKSHTVINNKREDLYIMSLFRIDFNYYEKRINFLLKSFTQ
jgi:RimJ/RimL family protein N-acetyltransferase